LIAEIDLIGVRKNYIDIYEVKCSHRISKAKHQLKKIKKVISVKTKVRNVFFFCGGSGQLIPV